MGQDMPAHPAKDLAKGPAFAVWALKDPESGNLDRIQIVKGFINKWGRTDEKIYDVALSDNRKADAKTGMVPPVGNTVDIKTAKYTNDIGDTQLSAVWRDPDFDPTMRAVYYVRVLEIPTPRSETICHCQKMFRPPSRNAHGPRPSGTRLRPKSWRWAKKKAEKTADPAEKRGRFVLPSQGRLQKGKNENEIY
jgi:hypothetical protein